MLYTKWKGHLSVVFAPSVLCSKWSTRRNSQKWDLCTRLFLWPMQPGRKINRKKKPMTNSSKAQLVERYFFRRQVCVACYFWPKTLDWTRRTQGGKRLHMTEGIINSLHWPNGFRSAPLGSAWITPAHLWNGSAIVIVSRQAVGWFPAFCLT